MVIVALQKAKGPFSAYEGLKAPEEKGKEKIEGSILFEGLEEVLKQYEDVLDNNLNLDEVKAILTPEQINTFLQATIPYEAHKNYAENTGYFITKLIQNSYDAGNNGFKLNTNTLPTAINYIGLKLEGKKDKPLELLVEGDVGYLCGYAAKYSTISIAGDAGNWCGAEAKHSKINIAGDAGNWCGDGAKYSTISIAGNAGNWCGDGAKYSTISIAGNAGDCCGEWADYSTISIAGDVGGGCGRDAKCSVFKTPNRKTLKKLKQWVAKGEGNKLYFINPDGSEVLEWSE